MAHGQLCLNVLRVLVQMFNYFLGFNSTIVWLCLNCFEVSFQIRTFVVSYIYRISIFHILCLDLNDSGLCVCYSQRMAMTCVLLFFDMIDI